MRKKNIKWTGVVAIFAMICLFHVVSGSVPSAYAANSETLKLKIAECSGSHDTWMEDAKINVQVISDDVVIGEYTGTTGYKGDVEIFIEDISVGDFAQIEITPPNSPEAFTHIHVLTYAQVEIKKGDKRTGAWSLGSTGGSQMGGDACADQWWDEFDEIFLLFGRDD
jgi:hypothetical protein